MNEKCPKCGVGTIEDGGWGMLQAKRSACATCGAELYEHDWIIDALRRQLAAKDARIAELEGDDRRWYSEETMAAVVKERDAANKRIAELEKAGKAALTVLSGNSMTKGELIEALTLLRAALAPTAPGVEPDWAKG